MRTRKNYSYRTRGNAMALFFSAMGIVVAVYAIIALYVISSH